MKVRTSIVNVPSGPKRTLNDPPRYWEEEGLPEGDTGVRVITDDPAACRMQVSCWGCGEHRVFTDKEWAKACLLDQRYCPRCQVRLEAEAAAERGLLQ